MCGRFALKNQKGLQTLFEPLGITVPEIETRYNISPGTDICGLLNDLQFHTDIHWGITPAWAKKSDLLINARSETIREKPSFREHFKLHRMIIPASGFYEWKREGNKKIPYYFYESEDMPLMIAGIYSINRDGIIQCCIITTVAGKAMSVIHDRQPVILNRDSMKDWLLTEDGSILDELMKAHDGLKMHRVSEYVNHSKNEGERCLQPDPD